MQHSAEYNRIMKERKMKERKRRQKVGYVMFGGGVLIVALALTLLIMSIVLKSDHKKAVKNYKENNWVSIENIPGGRSIHGKSGGNEFSYNDNGTYFDGIYVDGVHIGGMTYDEARLALIDVVEDRLNDISIVVKVGDASLALSSRDFNISVDVNEVLDAAYKLGRESINDYYANYQKQQAISADHVEFHINYTCDRERIG
ncbi:MAG: hypothetical protein IJM18_06480, partial [Clostridia bacterium]|nr:hypothetical protein [Clostridia bacterium]